MNRALITAGLFLSGCGAAAANAPERATSAAEPVAETSAAPDAGPPEPTPPTATPTPPPATPVATIPTDADGLESAEVPSPCGDGTRIVLSGGTGHYPSTIGLETPGDVELHPIATADLDGDGTAEMIALVICMPGGSGTFDSVRAYHVEDERVVEVAAIEGGDRADGGLDTPRVVNRDVIVGRFSGDDDGVCCPTHVTDETWRLRRGRFTRVRVGSRRAVDR